MGILEFWICNLHVMRAYDSCIYYQIEGMGILEHWLCIRMTCVLRVMTVVYSIKEKAWVS